MPHAVIAGIASFLPETVVTNEDLSREMGSWSADEIYQKTGIRERRIAADGQCASDLAVAAVQKLIERNVFDPAEADYLLFCTQSPDHFLPSSACLIQERVGLPRTCGAMDFNQGCSGYVLGLSLAKGLIVSGQAKCVLLATGETYSKFIHPQDRSVRTLFGDGATATVIRAASSGEGIGEFAFGTDGRGGQNLIVPAGGMRLPRSEKTAREIEDRDGNRRSENHLYMNGRQVFRFAIECVPRIVEDLLRKTALTLDDLDFVVLHQANRYMLDELVRKMHIPREKAPYEFEDVGNTVSSTIPIVLERLAAKGLLQSGRRLLLVGFGVGYSWAAATLTWR